MALFQEAIIKKHLLTLDAHVLDSAYNEYKRVYSPEKIKNIRVAKEEQYQEGFIKEIFGSVLGYSVYPESPFNIETEKKNETNARKADGAILSGEKVVGVIELKDNKTKNLDAVKDQAFGYKNNHKDCSYVISSNFHKLRFYIDDATDYEEFDLYNLDKETFKRFYLYLRKEGLLDKNLPKLLRQETKFHEEEISKKLYKDYSNFKRRFFENAVQNNPQHDKLELFKKSQKFLDRILFLLFAEDKGLVGTNSIVSIVEKWSGADDDYYQPLYEMVNKYFGHLYRGYTYQKTGEVIPQFGGELFAPDELLESLKIDDEVLKNDLLILSKYDFNTDVDVNILGHIFEHSLNEVDDVEAELRGETLDKSKSKRKKDGVFYTPKYITKYIVDNTLGKLCTEKKIEHKLDEDIAIFDYQKADGKLNEKGKELFERLNTYKSWLLTLKVCDPACGSGAFLNQALSFFIEEHKFVDDLIAELTNSPLRLFDTDLQILENNIFGVDINEESIEIAKLSLWLRTAQSGRKLSDLSNNIKCGNSLIDDPAVAGDKAFIWQEEFPEVFEKGGFDVVIGNPPYGAKLPKQDIKFIVNKYSDFGISNGLSDTYFVFYALSLSILISEGGVLGFITPNTWRLIDAASIFRQKILNTADFNVYSIIQHNEKVFSDATVDCDTLLIQKKGKNNLTRLLIKNKTEIVVEHTADQNHLRKQPFVNLYLSEIHYKLIEKIRQKSVLVGDLFEIKNGVKPYEKGKGKPPQTAEIMENKPFTSENKVDDSFSPLIGGSSFHRYTLLWNNDYWIQYGEWLAAPRDPEIFRSKEKLIFRQTSDSIVSTFLGDGYIIRDNTHVVLKRNEDQDLKFLLSQVNSKLIDWVYWTMNPEKGEAMAQVKAFHIGLLPYFDLQKSQQAMFIVKVETMLQLNQEILARVRKFVSYIKSQFSNNKGLGKIEKWYEMHFSDFIKELNKLVKTSNGNTLTKKDEFEWLELFEENKKKALDIKSQIDQTEKEIDRMVYELYGLTEEEIQIVENS